jgi:hypothetical protein
MRRLLILLVLVAGMAVTASPAVASPPKALVAVLTTDTVAGCQTAADAFGLAVVTVSQEGTLRYRLYVFNLDNVISAHIHSGGPGETGPVEAALFDAGAGSSVDADGLLARGTITDPALVEALVGGQPFYVNVHTTECPDGALRGQLRVIGGGSTARAI